MVILLQILSLLSWDNFKGEKGPAAAMSYTAINIDSYQVNGKTFYKVEAIFSEELSYTNTTSPYILQHEQLHWDITRLYSNYLTTKLIPYQGKNKHKEVERIYRKVIDLWSATQRRYDRETQHSLNKQQQEKWIQIINSKSVIELEE